MPSLILGILLFPLLAGLILNGAAAGEEQTAVIGLDFQAGTQPGEPDRLIGNAPPGMELAVYLNDELLDVTDSNSMGEFSLDMPILSQRRNDITVLPTELDSSTLALLYDPRGFDSLHIPPARTLVDIPFLAAAIRQTDGLQLYGSAVPFTQVEIFAESCLASKPNVTVEPDDEGSFTALLPMNANARLPDEYCIRVTPDDEPSAGETYQVAAPAQSRGVWRRSVELKFTPTEVSLAFSVEMPDGYLVYQNLASGKMSELQFIEYVFGEVSLNAYLDPRKLAWRQEKKPGSDRARVIIESQPLVYLIPDDTATTFQLNTSRLDETVPPYSEDDTIAVTLDGVHVLESAPPATSSAASEADWRGVLPEQPTLTLWVSRSPLPPADPIARARLLDTLSTIVTELKVNPPALLDKTLEGQIVGILPERVPAAVKAQVYDYYSGLDRGGEFTVQAAEPRTFQSFLRDLPARVPTWLADLLFGAIWLIPAALALVALQADDSAAAKDARDDLARLAAGVIVLTLLGLNWFPAFARLGLGRGAYINWLIASHLVFLVLFLPLPRLKALHSNSIALFGVAMVSALLAAFAGGWLQTVLPDGWLSALLTGLPLLGCAFLFWQGSQIGAENARTPSLSISIFALAVILGLSLPIQSLPLATQLGGSLGVTTLGVNLARPLISISLLLGIVMALRLRFDHPIGGRMSPLERGLGRVLLVGFAVGVSPAWGFVPVSVIGASLLFEWLLPVRLLQPEKTAAEFAKTHHEVGVKQMLSLNRQNRLWRSFESSAPKNIRENKLSEEEYYKKRQEHEEQKLIAEQPKYLKTDKLTLRDLAFNFGAGPRHRDNLRHALAWGLILAAPLVIFQGWPLVMSEAKTAGTFPFLSVGVRLLALTAQYLAAAALLGYFFPYLRGRNGLEKGGWLAGTIILSFLPYHLIYDTTALEWMVAGIWAGSILAFNLIVSLLAFDIRTLLHFKLGWFRLPDLYDFGELAAYLTGSGSPFIAAVFTTFTNKLDEWVPALLNVVFPSFTLTSAHSELLQVLLDLANRIASGLFS